MGRLSKLIPRFSLRTAILFLLLCASAGWLWRHWEAWACLQIFVGHESRVKSLSFSPDGQYLVTAGSFDKTVRVWDIATGGCVRVIPNRTRPGLVSDHAACVAVSPDGKRIAVGGELYDQVRVFDTATGACVNSWDIKPQQIIKSIAFSSDGSIILTADCNGAASLWDAGSGDRIRKIEHDGMVWWASFSPDEKLVLTACTDGYARVWDTASGEIVAEWNVSKATMHFCLETRFHPDGRHVLTVDWDEPGAATLRDIDGGQERVLWELGEVGQYSVEYSPDGGRILSALGDRTATIRDADTGRLIAVLRGHTDHVVFAKFSSGGDWVATGSMDNTARIWKRRRPEWWWGVFYLWELWLTVLFAAAFVWSVLRDRKTLRREAA